VNIAYKHLDTKLRVADLTIGQWLSVFAGLALAVLWGMYLSPFGTYVTLLSAIYLGGIPIGASLLAGITEFDLWLLIRSAMRWRRREGRFVPGPGDLAHGYVVSDDERDRTEAARVHLDDLDLASLWEES
jgi:hypothetical protein